MTGTQPERTRKGGVIPMQVKCRLGNGRSMGLENVPEYYIYAITWGKHLIATIIIGVPAIVSYIANILCVYLLLAQSPVTKGRMDGQTVAP